MLMHFVADLITHWVLDQHRIPCIFEMPGMKVDKSCGTSVVFTLLDVHYVAKKIMASLPAMARNVNLGCPGTKVLRHPSGG